MFCPCCGKEIDDDSTFCSYCGHQMIEEPSVSKNVSNIQKEPTGIAVTALIFGILGGLLGLIFGINGLKRCKNPRNKAFSIVGIVGFAVWFTIAIILSCL